MQKEKLNLTNKQQQFVEACRAGRTANEAAILAGYSPNLGANFGTKLQSNPKIAKAIACKENHNPSVTQEMVINELAAIGFAAISDICKWDEGGVHLVESSKLSREQTAAVAEIIESSSGKASVRIKLHAKLKALEMLGRHLGLFTNEASKPESAGAFMGKEQSVLSAEFNQELDAFFPENSID